MHTSLSKKLLAGLLSLVMVLSLVAPSMGTQAASKYTLTDKKSVKSGVTFKYELKGVSKNQYVKITRNVSGETVKYNKKAVSKTTKIKGTGKTLNLYVTYGEKEENYTGKITVKIYNNKTNKVVKTIVEKVTVKVPEKEEPEEPVEEEAALVSLEATGSKELTATLSKEAEVAAADVVVKKGTVVVTPADVKSEGTKVVITLGSKITEGTYSVTYKEKTVEVATVDEKLTELKTIGNNFAQLDVSSADWTSKNGKLGGVGHAPIDNGAVAKEGNVAATIEYQALNQYGEPMIAEINNVVSSFGGDVDFTEPTAKQNGVIEVINIASSIGLVGNTGKIIIVSKDGVSSTNEVTFSEESKLAKIELAGILCQDSKSGLVESIPATKAISDYKLLFKAYDQYGYEVSESKIEDQSISQAQVLTNVKVKADEDGNGKIDKNAVLTETVDGVEYYAFELKSSDENATAMAGTLQLIIVGNRFGSVLNTTIKVEQRNLIKSFTMTAPEQIYNKDANEISYVAVDTEGKEITDYKDLKALVKFDSEEFRWVRNSDGSAKLVYTPNLDEEKVYPGTTSVKQNTVTTVTVKANEDFSKADQLVTTKTFTVYQAKIPTSIVKYTGSTGSTDNNIYVYKNKFVFEDQYGNTLTVNDGCWKNINVVYVYTKDNSGTKTANKAEYGFETAAGWAEKVEFVENAKLYALLDTSKYYAEGKFDITKADVVLTFKAVSTTKATNLKATYKGDILDYIQKVGINSSYSGITAGDFKVTGTVNGVNVTIPAKQVSLVSDSYVAINKDEYETAVKKATVKLNIALVDENKEDYYETIEAEYTYSAAAPYQYCVAGETDAYDYVNHTTKYGYYEAGKLTAKDFNDNFACYDQYGDVFPTTLTYDVKLGAGTDANWSVKNPGLATCYVNVKPDFDGEAHIYVTATSSKGLTDTVEWIVTGKAASTADKDGLEAAKASVAALSTDAKYTSFEAIADEIEKAGNGYVSAVTVKDEAQKKLRVVYPDLTFVDMTFKNADNYSGCEDNTVLFADGTYAEAIKAIDAYKKAVEALDGTKAKYDVATDAKKAAEDAVKAWTTLEEEQQLLANYNDIATANGKYNSADTDVAKVTLEKTSASVAATAQTYTIDAAALGKITVTYKDGHEAENTFDAAKLSLPTNGTPVLATTNLTTTGVVTWTNGDLTAPTYVFKYTVNGVAAEFTLTLTA